MDKTCPSSTLNLVIVPPDPIPDYFHDIISTRVLAFMRVRNITCEATTCAVVAQGLNLKIRTSIDLNTVTTHTSAHRFLDPPIRNPQPMRRSFCHISGTRMASFRTSSATSTTTKETKKRPRRFAPLNPDVPNEDDAPRLKGIVFDVDGTLW